MAMAPASRFPYLRRSTRNRLPPHGITCMRSHAIHTVFCRDSKRTRRIATLSPMTYTSTFLWRWAAVSDLQDASKSADRRPKELNCFMVVSIVVSKLQDGRIQLSAIRPNHSANSSRDYGCLTDACTTLLNLGIPKGAVAFYLTVFLPLLDTKHTIAFPEIDIPESRLRKHGFNCRERAA